MFTHWLNWLNWLTDWRGGTHLKERGERGELRGAEERELPSPQLDVHLVALRVARHFGVRELHDPRPLGVHHKFRYVALEFGEDLALVQCAAVAHNGEQ